MAVTNTVPILMKEFNKFKKQCISAVAALPQRAAEPTGASAAGAKLLLEHQQVAQGRE